MYPVKEAIAQEAAAAQAVAHRIGTSGFERECQRMFARYFPPGSAMPGTMAKARTHIWEASLLIQMKESGWFHERLAELHEVLREVRRVDEQRVEIVLAAMGPEISRALNAYKDAFYLQMLAAV